MPTLNWVYGAKSPDISEAIEAAILAAHRYRNKLCELELAKRERHYALLRELAPEFVIAEAAVKGPADEVKECREEIKMECAKQQTKKPKGVSQWTSRIAELKGPLKELRAVLKEKKLAAYTDPKVRVAMDTNSVQHKDDCATAKKESGLYWGTEGFIRNSCRPFAKGAPPKYARFRGEGQVAIQIQKGLDCAEIIVKSNTLCYIEPGDGKLAICWFRVASDEKGKPVFASVPIIFHRPMPKGGRIKMAFLERRKIADHVRWSIRLTIDVPMPDGRDTYSWAAIHCGWTMQPNGLRVAIWQGSDGVAGAMVLPPDHLADYDRLDNIRSDRDLQFNAAMASLIAFCTDRELPEWLEERRPHFAKWKSQARLSWLVTHWRDNRFDDDAEIFDQLESWRKPDKHKWQHERRLSVRVVRRRTDLYRNLAKQLSVRYGVLYYSQIDAKDLTENSQPEELKRDNTASHRHAKQAAVSDFVQKFKQKFPFHAICTDTENMTIQCSNCGELCRRVKSRRLVVCDGCGKTHDEDSNALANTIARGEAMQKSGALLAMVEKHEEKEESKLLKLAKMQQANRDKVAARKIANKPKI